MNDDTQKFINSFINISPTKNVIETFSCGACYWFATILCQRFATEGAELYYAPIDNHFVTMINNRIYDITGDVTGQYDIIKWSDFNDDLEKARIMRDCIQII